MAPAADITGLIRLAQSGDAAAAEAIFEATYEDLRRMARARLGAHRRQTLLDTTGLVHEWFLRFSRTRGLRLEDRRHFMRYAARAMRSIIVDFARARGARRRGGDATAGVRLEEALVPQPPEEILAVHRALETLSGLDARMADVVELRYFAGLVETEVAETLGVTERTVRRDWEKARLWLARALG